MKHLRVTRYCNAWVLTFLILIPSITAPLLAAENLSGELWMNGDASVNGKSASTGLAVLSGNRIQTGKNGTAVINFGKLGRIKLQPESDLVLTFTETTINGNLNTGVALVNAPEFVVVNIKTPCGEFDSARQISASTTMEVTAATPLEAVAVKPKDDTKTQSDTKSGAQAQNVARCSRVYVPIAGKAAALPVFFGSWGFPALILGGIGAVLVPVVAFGSSDVSGIFIGPQPVTPVRPN